MPIQSSMTLSSTLALFSAMTVLAAIPSLSVLTVSTRAATSGFIHGAFTTLGIVSGDIVFIIITLGGLSLFSEMMGSLFALIRYLGGAYLILLGINLCRSKFKDIETNKVVKSSLLSSFFTGLFITLGDQKATIFYMGFLPAFVDIYKISYLDVFMIITITILSVGGVKLCYAFMADRNRFSISPKITKRINIAAGCVMIAVGCFLLTKS